MVALALLARIRIWLWAALVALATVPAMFGYASETVGAALTGHLAAAYVAFGLIALARRVAPRFAGPLVAEERTLTFVQIAAVPLALVLLPFVEAGSNETRWLVVAGALAGLSVLGVLSSRHPARGFWSTLAGFAGVAAVAVLPFATGLGEVVPLFWGVAVLAAGASVGLIAAWALTATLRGVGRRKPSSAAHSLRSRHPSLSRCSPGW